jgi:hypothetical protein
MQARFGARPRRLVARTRWRLNWGPTRGRPRHLVACLAPGHRSEPICTRSIRPCERFGPRRGGGGMAAAAVATCRAWLSRLPELPAIQHLLRVIQRSPGCGGARVAGVHRRGSQGDAPEFLALPQARPPRRSGGGRRDARGVPCGVGAVLAPADAESLRGMRSLVATILNHLERFKRVNVRDAWQERSALERELQAVPEICASAGNGVLLPRARRARPGGCARRSCGGSFGAESLSP